MQHIVKPTAFGHVQASGLQYKNGPVNCLQLKVPIDFTVDQDILAKVLRKSNIVIHSLRQSVSFLNLE